MKKKGLFQDCFSRSSSKCEEKLFFTEVILTKCREFYLKKLVRVFFCESGDRAESYKFSTILKKNFITDFSLEELFQNLSPGGVLKNFTEFTEKHLRQSLFFKGLQLY